MLDRFSIDVRSIFGRWPIDVRSIFENMGRVGGALKGWGRFGGVLEEVWRTFGGGLEEHVSIDAQNIFRGRSVCERKFLNKKHLFRKIA